MIPVPVHRYRYWCRNQGCRAGAVKEPYFCPEPEPLPGRSATTPPQVFAFRSCSNQCCGSGSVLFARIRIGHYGSGSGYRRCGCEVTTAFLRYRYNIKNFFFNFQTIKYQTGQKINSRIRSRIRIRFIELLNQDPNPDPYQNDTAPQHWFKNQKIIMKTLSIRSRMLICDFLLNF